MGLRRSTRKPKAGPLYSAVFLVALAGACRPPGPAAPAVESALSDVPPLCEVPAAADRLPLVHEFLPPVLAGLAPLQPRPDETPQALEAQAQAGVRRFQAGVIAWRASAGRNERGDVPALATLQAFLELLGTACRLEERLLGDDGIVPAELAPLFEPVYDVLQLYPVVARIPQSVIPFYQALMEHESPGSDLGPLLDGIGELLRVLPERAGALHRRVALALACDATPDDPESRLALVHLAESASDAGRWDEALRGRTELARRLSDDPDAFCALAEAAYRAGRPELGDSAAERAAAVRGVPCTTSAGVLDPLREAAHRIATATTPAGLEERLALAAAHETLGHIAEARALLAEAVAERPEDARAFVAQARLLLAHSGDIAAAADLLGGAGPENRDDDYWAILAVGGVQKFLRDDAPSAAGDREAFQALAVERLGAVRNALDHYAEFHPELAAPALTLVRAVHRGLERSLAGEDAAQVFATELARLADDALALAGDGMPTADASRLLLQIVLFRCPCEQAVRALDVPPVPPPADDPAAAALRVVAELETAARCARPERLERARAIVEGLPGGDPEAAARRMAWAGEVAAVQAWLGVGDTTAADLLLSSAVDDPALPDEERGRVAVNLAVVRAAIDGAWSTEMIRAVEDRAAGDDRQIARLNRVTAALLALDAGPEVIEEARQALTEVAADGSALNLLRRHALRWLAWLARREERAEEVRALLEQADQVCAARPSGIAAVDAGILVNGEPLVVGLSYLGHGCIAMTGGGFGLSWGVESPDVWLLVRPP
ncbi:MAG: hypothetical protein JXB32_11020 [Deltaproteobacteria bacterium]|nr:hypothetical protein [Deltaproteobacteria bacterium]